MADHTSAGFSADTEVLARRGWLTFDQVTCQDEVATRSPDGRFEWQHPEHLSSRYYDGDMILFARGGNLLVTPQHPMPWTREGGSRVREKVGFAGELERSPGGCLIAASAYDAPDLASKTFRVATRASRGPAPRELTMTGDQFAAFMGMWLSEGCAYGVSHDWLTRISQTGAGKGYAEYRDALIDIFGREPARNAGAWVIHGRALCEYLMPLGKAVSKRMPREVLDLSRRQLQIFWDFYFLGDGNYAWKQQVGATASPEMAGQFQEVIQKLGRWANAREIKCKGNALVPGERLIYKLGIRQCQYPGFAATRAAYTGIVHHLATTNGTVFARRAGRATWAGT